MCIDVVAGSCDGLGGGDGPGGLAGVAERLGPDLGAVAVGAGRHCGLSASSHPPVGDRPAGAGRAASLPGGHRSGELGLGAHPGVPFEGAHVGRMLDAESVRRRLFQYLFHLSVTRKKLQIIS